MTLTRALRGVCTFQEKVDAALAAGCRAVLIYNQGDTPNRMNVFQGAFQSTALPGNTV